MIAVDNKHSKGTPQTFNHLIVMKEMKVDKWVQKGIKKKKLVKKKTTSGKNLNSYETETVTA